MRGALASHMNLRRMQRQWQPLFDWDFTQQSPGALVLPTGLTFARASSGHSVQTGTNGLIVGGAIASNDVGRIGRLLDAHSYGLLIEPLTLNKFGYANTPASAPGADSGTPTYTTGQSDPAGGTAATRIQVPSGGYSKYQTLTASTNGVISAWVKQGSGSGAYQTCAPYAGTAGAGVGGTAGALWTRVASANFPYGGTVPNFVASDGRANATLGSSAGARDCVLYGLQFEDRKYATSLVLTSGGSTATRAAERLTIDSTRATQATVNGCLGFYVRFRAITALASMDGSAEGQILLGVGSTCYVRISPTSRYILLGDGGSKYSQTANSVISWSTGDLVEMVMELGNGVSAFRWRINGGSVNTASFTAQNDSLDPIVPSSGLDVLCAGTSWHTPAVLEQATLFVPGRAPF